MKKQFADRVKAVLTALTTWLVTIAAVLSIVLEELGSVAGVPAVVVRIIATALVVCAVAVVIIRRTVTLIPDDRTLTSNGPVKLIAPTVAEPSAPKVRARARSAT